jgi:serine acetyltransferase
MENLAILINKNFQYFPDNSDNMARDIFTSLVYAREIPGIGVLAYFILKLLGLEIPLSVEIGENFEIAHGGFGVVVHPWTTIGNLVKI